MSLTRTAVPLEAAKTLLASMLPQGLTVSIDADTITVGTVSLTPVTTPIPVAVTMGAPERADFLMQVTIRGHDRTHARLAGDAVRDILSARARGGPTNPLTAEDYRFDPVTSQRDGHGDTLDGVHTWVETYRIGWQHRVTPPDAP